MLRDKKEFAQQQTGFTLIELLVVIAIIGTLASVVLASLNSARAKSRDAKRSADIDQVQLALELFYDENNRYPLDSVDRGGGTSYRLDDIVTDLTPTYLPSIPDDPTYGGTSNDYRYGTNSAGTMYTILIRYEDNSTWCEISGGAGDPHWSYSDC